MPRQESQKQSTQETQQAVDDVPRWAARAAGHALSAAAAVAAFHAALALWTGRSRWLVAALGILSIGCLAARRMGALRRAQVGLMAGALVVILYGYQGVLALRRPRAATAAWLAGRSWDARHLADVLHDERAGGREAWPSLRPRMLYKWQRGGLRIEGREVLPLGGISRVSTPFGNESGVWSTYMADEHGFNNPAGLWSGPVDVALIGDSFTQGAYVPEGRDLAAVIRRARPSTLNLGMLGNGPLIELGTIVEYLPRLTPRWVLWLYFRNDLSDLAFESTIPLLRRYASEPGFSQGLEGRQAALDEGMRRAAIAVEADGAWWPSTLARLGISRRGAPVWVQDLALKQRQSSWSALVRLDGVYDALGASEERAAPEKRSGIELFLTALERAHRVVTGWKGDLVFVYLPDLWPAAGAMKDHPERKRVLGAARAAGLPVIDVHAAFKERSDEATLVPYPDAHFNETGYALVGQAILDGLARIEAQAR